MTWKNVIEIKNLFVRSINTEKWPYEIRLQTEYNYDSNFSQREYKTVAPLLHAATCARTTFENFIYICL